MPVALQTSLQVCLPISDLWHREGAVQGELFTVSKSNQVHFCKLPVLKLPQHGLNS